MHPPVCARVLRINKAGGGLVSMTVEHAKQQMNVTQFTYEVGAV